MSSLSKFLHPIPHLGHREGPRDCRMLCYRVGVLRCGVGVRAGAETLPHKSYYIAASPQNQPSSRISLG